MSRTGAESAFVFLQKQFDFFNKMLKLYHIRPVSCAAHVFVYQYPLIEFNEIHKGPIC